MLGELRVFKIKCPGSRCCLGSIRVWGEVKRFFFCLWRVDVLRPYAQKRCSFEYESRAFLVFFFFWVDRFFWSYGVVIIAYMSLLSNCKVPNITPRSRGSEPFSVKIGVDEMWIT